MERLTAGETHRCIIRLLHNLFLGIKFEDCQDGRELLLLRDQHLPRCLADDGRLEEVSVITLRPVKLIAAHYDLATMLLCIGDVRLSLIQTSRGCHWTHCHTLSCAVPDFDRLGLLRENLGEFVVHAFLDVDAI